MKSRIYFLSLKKALTVAPSEKGRKLIQLGHPVTIRAWKYNQSINFFPYKKRNPKKRKIEDKCMLWIHPLDDLMGMQEDGIDITDIMQLCTKNEKYLEYFISKSDKGRTFYEFKIGRDVYRRDIDAHPIAIFDASQMERAGIPLFVHDEEGELVEL